MKRSTLFKFLLFALLAFPLARFCHHQTKGFAVSKIVHNFSPHEEDQCLYGTPLALEQPFHFLSRGAQSFVFISEDGQYILKLLNNKDPSRLSLLSYFPGTQGAQQRLNEKIRTTFASYRLAFERMADKTALLYLHLQPTSHLPSKLTLIDPLQISHTLDPNGVAFLLQRKVDLVYPQLHAWIASGEKELAQQGISSLLQLFLWKERQGILDRDPLIRTNYGFLEGQAVQIDVGPLFLGESAAFAQELQRVMASLKNWLSLEDPSLVSYLDQELAKALSLEG